MLVPRTTVSGIDNCELGGLVSLRIWPGSGGVPTLAEASELGVSMRRRGGLVGRHRAAIAANLALLVTVGAVVAYAVSADGYPSHRTDLNDGGIWVTSNADGIFGRINKPIGQADGALFADQDDNLDIVQQDAAVVGVNLTQHLLTSIDPSTVQPVEGEEATIPTGARVVMAGNTLAVLDPSDGRVWAQRIDSHAGLPSVTALADAAEPLGEVGGTAALTVTTSGAVLASSAETDRLVRWRATGADFAEAEELPLELDLGASPSLTAVGERPVVLDGDTGSLVVVDGGSAALPPGSVLQQPGPAAGSVVVATRTELLDVDLGTGDATALAADLSGRPTAPVRLGACRYGAWSGGRGAVVTVCRGAEPQTGHLVSDATDLVFRVNRGQILLNDRDSGAVWDLDSDSPARIDDWDAFLPDQVEQDDSENEQEDQDAGDRQPPKAKPDDFGARPGRITVLHPLDNDTAPSGRILAIRSVTGTSGPGTLSIGPDGQTVQITLPPDAVGPTTFDYVIDDGREDVSDQASVSVRPRDIPANGAPTLRSGYHQRDWVVASGGTLDVPVLPDWRDPRDGDPLALVSATAVDGVRSGAVARTTAAGRIRLTAPVEAGVVTVEYAVGDGIGEPVTEKLDFRVQDQDDTQSIAAVAEPDIVSGEAGKPITIRPLGNDLPGTDPLTPEATLELAGKIAAVGGADVRTDLVEGTITFRSRTPRTYLLDYDAAYGGAPIAPGRIRVDVREPARPARDPVAMPDQVTLFGQAPTMVDVLANDVDPAGGMLVVQRAEPRTANQVDVAVVQGRWVRVSARQGTLAPNPQIIRYTVSNGTGPGVEGEITVSQRDPVDDNTPVTQVDRVTVRAGTAITVPVLDNDFSPSGDLLRLVSHVQGEGSGQLKVTATDGTRSAGDVGAGFVAGRLVRFVAPRTVDDVTDLAVRYLATNEAGQTSPGRVEITVVPAARRNQAPEPPPLEGRTVAGDTVKLRLPGVGVDPDGDAVTLLGLGSAPRLGRIVTYGANSLEYQAYPGSGGTDEFQYRVVDAFGEPAVGTARVAVVPAGLPQPPLAVADTVTVAPGRRTSVDVMANDLVGGGDRVTIALPDPPPGVRLQSETGPVVIDAPTRADGRNVDVVYRLSNGLDTSQATVTLRTAKDVDLPPIVYDAFGTAEDADTVTVDVLETAYDPDGAAEDLTVTDVFVPAGTPPAEVVDGRITVARGDQPSVVPFRVEDADGGAATGSLYVPARGRNLPYVRDGALIELAPGESVRARLSDYVVNPAGGPVTISLPDRVAASPDEGLAVVAAGKSAVTVRAASGYAGPGAAVVEVTTGATAAGDGQVSMLTIPVQVGQTRPILTCPSEPIEVPQGESVEVPVSAHCHVWTSDPDEAAGLAFDADWDERVDGLTARSDGGVIVVTASAGARRDTRGVLAVTAGGSEPGLLRFVVTGGPPPSLSPIRVSDMRSGQSRVLDLAPYLRPGVGDPEPTVLEARQLTGLDVDIDIVSATEVRITTGADVAGSAEFQVVMSDVARADAGPERRVEGRISLDVLDVPDAPSAPVPGSSVVSQQVSLTWAEPPANGATDRLLRGPGVGRPHPPLRRHLLRDRRADQRPRLHLPGAGAQRRRLLGVERLLPLGDTGREARSGRADPQHPGRRPDPRDRLDPAARHDLHHRLLRRDLRRDQPQDLASRGDHHRAGQQPQVRLQGVRRERRRPRAGPHVPDLPVPGPGRHPRGADRGRHAHVELRGDGHDQLAAGAAQRSRAGQLPRAAQRRAGAGLRHPADLLRDRERRLRRRSQRVPGGGQRGSRAAAVRSHQGLVRRRSARPVGRVDRRAHRFRRRGPPAVLRPAVARQRLHGGDPGGRQRRRGVRGSGWSGRAGQRREQRRPARRRPAGVQRVRPVLGLGAPGRSRPTDPCATSTSSPSSPSRTATTVRWAVTVDTNGDPADVRVQGSTGRDITLAATGVDVQTVYTGWRRPGAGHHRGGLRDAGRLDVRTVASPRGRPRRAPPTPTPAVQISRGAACGPPCQPSPSDPQCVNNCAFLVVTWSDFYPFSHLHVRQQLRHGSATSASTRPRAPCRPTATSGTSCVPTETWSPSVWVNVQCRSGPANPFSEMNW